MSIAFADTFDPLRPSSVPPSMRHSYILVFPPFGHVAGMVRKLRSMSPTARVSGNNHYVKTKVCLNLAYTATSAEVLSFRNYSVSEIIDVTCTHFL